jgi:hypothetical protein
MSSILTILLLVSAAIVGCHAQSAASVWVESSTYPGAYGYFSTNFVGLKLDSTGRCNITWLSGDNALYDMWLAFADHTNSQAFGGTYQYNDYITATGTYWVYLATYSTTNNYDYLQIRVVANTYTGTITALYSSPPVGWQTGYPPIYSAMIAVDNNGQPIQPQSQPASNDITKWLVPLLVVVIVTALAIPIGFYIRHRRQQKNEAQAQTTQVEAQAVQMASV